MCFVIPREGGVSRTPRSPDSSVDAFGILDHPLSQMMTRVGYLLTLKKSRNNVAASFSPTAE
jgi:hypothetical protein